VKVREKVKGSGIWWIFISHEGQRKAKKIGKDKKLALDVATKIEARLVLKEFNIDQKNENPAPTFDEFSKIWLETYIKPLRRASTYERYETVLRKYINPVIGKLSVSMVKRKDIRNMLLKYHTDECSRSLICLVRDVTSGVLGYAVEDELIDANPVTGILKRLKLEPEKKLQIAPMTSEEVSQFLVACQKLYPEYYVFFLCAFRTGARLGELIALHWSDLDWNKQNILIKRSFRRGVVNKPKNGKTRLVDLSDQLIESFHNPSSTTVF